MVQPGTRAIAIRAATLRLHPALREVGLPPPPVFGALPPNPEYYPDLNQQPGCYLPVPPPPGVKIENTSSVSLMGSPMGRPWRVDIDVSDSSMAIAPPTVRIRTAVRLTIVGERGAPVLPWLLAASEPQRPQGVVWSRTGKDNVVAIEARMAVGRAGLLFGRPVGSGLLPPVCAPMYSESWDPSVTGFLRSPPFLESFARWEARAGRGLGSSGSVLPMLAVTADQLTFCSGVDVGLPPEVVGWTMAELMAFVDGLERQVTGLNPARQPIPTISAEVSLGSVPDPRPAYRCPRCAKMEIIRRFSPPKSGIVHFQTLGCGVDIFPPMRDRLGEVIQSYRTSAGV